MVKRAASSSSSSSSTASSPAKKVKRGSSTEASDDGGLDVLGKGKWRDWPAPQHEMEAAREFFRECAQGRHLTILVPDKDADGLSSGMVAHKTLTTLGLPSEKIKIHLLQKGTSVFSAVEQERMEALINESLVTVSASEGDVKLNIKGKGREKAEESDHEEEREARVIVLDQGSRPGPPLVRPDQVKARIRTLIVDHHMSTSWPEGAQILSACRSSPIATSSLLTYLTCAPLHPSLPHETAWYAILGVFGDLGPGEIAWGKRGGEWPNSAEMVALGEEVKRLGKKPLNSAVSALNAPRRTAEYNVIDAWNALFSATAPEQIAASRTLQDARDLVNREVERCTHTAPKFSKDGRCALLRIDSGYQVHPVIATRWAGTLKGAKKLQMIMVENPGHNPNPDITSFSCRIPSTLRKLPESERPNLIELLKEYGAMTDEGFLSRVGEDFARGHKEATGGIIARTEFELFAEKGMEIGVKDPNAPPTKKELKNRPAQKNNLMNYFAKSPSKPGTGDGEAQAEGKVQAKKEEDGVKQEIAVG